MIETFTLADMRRMAASRPMGWKRFTLGDLHLARGEKRLAKAFFREMARKRYYTASNTGPQAVGGSAWTWQSSGGSFAITCTSLAAAASRQGVKSSTTIVAPPNGGTNVVPPSFFSVQLTCQFTSAPAAGGEVQVFFGFSPSATAGTSNPGGLTGTDAAGPNIDVFPMLTFCGSLIASNSLGTGVQFMTPFAIVNTDPANSPYMSPVIYNNASVAFDATALHTILTVVPYWIQTAL